ncbi:MAG: hypothetical protein AAF514_17515 [Verrucomicrobiota bacterium]
MAAAALLILTASAAFSIPPFSQYYTEDEAELPPFSTGSFFPWLGGVGYQLIANSQASTQAGETWGILSLARFDAEGNQLYSVYMDNGGEGGDEELTGDRDDPDKFFAGAVLGSVFQGDTISARMALIDGATLTPDYSVSVRVVSDPNQADLTFFPGKIAALSQEAGSFIRILTLDPEGNPVIDRDYTSDQLLGTSIQGISSQTENLSMVPDGSGYFLSIQWSQLDFADPLNFGRNNRFFLLRLDLTGNILWQVSFDLPSGAVPLVDISSPIADNAYLYRLTDNELNGQMARANTKVIKINADGSFGWAKRFDDLRLSSSAPTQFGNDLYLGGFQSDPGNPIASDVTFLQLNKDTGELKNAIRFDQGVSETGTLAGVTETAVFASVLNFAPTQNDVAEGEMDLIRMNRNLGNASGVRVSETGFGSMFGISDSEVLFSPYDSENNAVGAIAMDGTFNPLAEDCERLFTPATLNTVAPGVNPTDVEITLVNQSFEVTEVNSQLGGATLPVRALKLLDYGCDEDGPGNGNGNGNGGMGDGGDTDFTATIEIPNGETVEISFPTETGFNYDVMFTGNLAEEFELLQTLPGTGEILTIEQAIMGLQGFFQIGVSSAP